MSKIAEFPTMSKASTRDRSAISVGIIGMGDMGKVYARRISEAGWKVNACDRDDKYEALKEEYKELPNITILRNGHYVSRASDYIMYSVEAENIEKVVAAYGPSTKLGAIVGGQTSCKAPEIAAFEKHLPEDVEIVSCHSLHGPTVDPSGQPLVIIKHRSSEESFELAKEILSCFGSKFVYLSAAEHDRVTADTQAVTHAAFLSMGSAWHANDQFPWETPRWSSGIENVKINVTLRIYSNKWHVYAGLAILNPSARSQIKQYANSVTDLFKLMISANRTEFERRVRTAGEFVFGKHTPNNHMELLLCDEILEKYSFSSPLPLNAEIPKPNSHLSLLAMVDSWHQCRIQPYDHILCSTPLFRLWLGAAEYLFRQPHLLDACINAALGKDSAFKEDDLEFTFAARAWSEIVDGGQFEMYKRRFEKTQMYFEKMGRLQEAVNIGNRMIKTILQRTKELEAAASAKGAGNGAGEGTRREDVREG
ncbi:hypothetical protein EV426DRAFT_583208 [Tirmania nivea]|nr:hypothetical protein EV426DRAFT_583208 [Tirmania nivea]